MIDNHPITNLSNEIIEMILVDAVKPYKNSTALSCHRPARDLWYIKDTHREKATSTKTPALRKSTNMGVRKSTNMGVRKSTNMVVRKSTNIGVRKSTNMVVRKSTNMGVWATGKLNQLFIRGS